MPKYEKEHHHEHMKKEHHHKESGKTVIKAKMAHKDGEKKSHKK